MGEVMNNDLQKIWDALRTIYGINLMAATLTVLLQDGEDGENKVSFKFACFPQKTEVQDEHH
jgi:hypothetical protein